MSTAREARRKRIVERGSDRLAFITGQNQSLPPPPPPAAPPPSLPRTDIVGAAHGKNEAARVILQKEELGNEASSSSLDTRSNLKPSVSSSVQPSSRSVISSSNPAAGFAPQSRSYSSTFTCNRVISSISASANFRLLCSVIIALSAVLSYSIIPWIQRPIYLVLVTDVTIVVGGMLSNKNFSKKNQGEARTAEENTDDWADKVGKMLELGLLLQKALTAIFMDCCVCAVLLISGLSLRRLV